MKKLFPILLVATTLLAGAAQAANDIVFVDLSEIFKRFYKTQLAQDQIRQQAADIKIERDTMEDDIKGMREEIEELRADARDDTLSDDVRQSKRDQLEEKLVELQKRDQEILDYVKLREGQMEQQNARMSKKIIDEIQEAVNAYAKEKGCIAVIDRSAQSARTGTQVVLFVDAKHDITAELLVVLNEGHEVTVEEEPGVGLE